MYVRDDEPTPIVPTLQQTLRILAWLYSRQMSRVRIRVGVDWGRVVADNVDEFGIKYQLEFYHLRPEVPGAIDGVAKLIQLLAIANDGLPPFEDGLGDLLITRNGFGPAGEEDQQDFAAKQCDRWMQINRFYERTGLTPKHIIYAQTRQGKMELCKLMEITVLIEDRTQVGQFLDSSVRWIAFRVLPEEWMKFSQNLPEKVKDRMFPAKGWKEVAPAIFNPLFSELKRIRRMMDLQHLETIAERLGYKEPS